MARVPGDDGLIADDVGYWATEKHDYLVRYISISRAARKRYLPPKGPGGATFIDLFCGTGRSQVRDTGAWIDGSAVAAWKQSVKDEAPFTNVIIADKDPEALYACQERLKRLGAPVTCYVNEAAAVARQIGQTPTPYGLNLAFLDPYSLDLDFSIIQSFATVKRMDMMIHLNQMDMQRNLMSLASDSDQTRLDRFVPGWRDSVPRSGQRAAFERRIYEYWREKVRKLGPWPSAQQKLITASSNQPLYWLVLAASHELAHKFWGESLDDGQSELF
ncbi:hypothetical protein B9Z51_07020 [Limnohabitans sp. T6-5]|uniref:three-Cys-motif partner protein TcmP n=1 Tax=Limnohabitans sp. T6-5 TaxID=1100724 RepID=UPI000D3B84A1|nr:three-Cys-motif partner protein TcmP [Limnohabitans sp. T6-5]PUE08694.1 hypothetical protein B9Z51_07020 [Limnohabitans sp. T6-5]